MVEAAGAQHLTLDWIPLDEAHRRRPQAPARRAAGRGRHRRPHARRQAWIVTASAAEAPATYHLYEREQRQAHASCSAPAPSSRAYRLAPMHGEIIRARDGLELVSYLTLPHGSAAAARRRRCRWCCWCTAARGRATATASTPSTSGWPTAAMPCCRSTSAARPASARRSSTPATCEWGRKMHDDLIDAVDWAVEEGIADREPRRHHGRLLRRLCDAGRPRLHARGVLLRRRYRRPLQPGDAAGDHPALLGRVLREPRPPRRRSAHRGGHASCCRSARRSTLPATSPSRC